MKGHIHKRVRTLKDGKSNTSWYIVLELPRKQDNKRNQKWYGSFNTRKEAEIALGNLLGEFSSNRFLQPSKLKISDFIDNNWLPSMKSQLKPSTFDSYKRNLKLHVLPSIGQIYLKDLNPQILNKLYADLMDSGNKNRQGGLSTKTIRYIHTTIHKFLEDAIDLDLINRNPAERAKPPKLKRSPEIKSWDSKELALFLDSARDHKYYVAFHLAALTGMRRGEVLGLRWSDIDFNLSRISIRQSLISVAYTLTFSTPKSHQARNIDLDENTVQLLIKYKQQQSKDITQNGLNSEYSELVFKNEFGSPIHPDSFSQAFEKCLQKTSLPKIRLHDLRHTHASIALKAGVPIKVITERLGHENPAFTLKQYVHVIPGMQKEAASLVASLITDSIGT